MSLASVLLYYLLWPAKAKSISPTVDLLEEDDQGDVIEVSAKTIPEEQEAGWLPQRKEEATRGIETARFQTAGKAGR